METVTERTAGPWYVQGKKIKSAPMEYIADVCSEEDAALIVRAVNSFPALVEALKLAEQFIVNGVEFGFIRMPDKDDSALDTLPKIRAALSEVAVVEDTQQENSRDH